MGIPLEFRTEIGLLKIVEYAGPDGEVTTLQVIYLLSVRRSEVGNHPIESETILGDRPDFLRTLKRIRLFDVSADSTHRVVGDCEFFSILTQPVFGFRNGIVVDEYHYLSTGFLDSDVLSGRRTSRFVFVEYANPWVIVHRSGVPIGDYDDLERRVFLGKQGLDTLVKDIRATIGRNDDRYFSINSHCELGI
jgi:hypothetical protein